MITSTKKHKISKYSHYILILISFTESSIFFIPTYLAFISLCLYNKEKIYLYIFTTTLSSLLGGIFGYCLGYFAYDGFLADLIIQQNLTATFNSFKNLYTQYGIIAIFIGGFTPIPYKIIAISAGIFKFNLGYFILLSLFSRGIKFLIIGLIIKYEYKNLLQILKKRIKYTNTK